MTGLGSIDMNLHEPNNGAANVREPLASDSLTGQVSESDARSTSDSSRVGFEKSNHSIPSRASPDYKFVERSFWISTQPFFESSLLLFPIVSAPFNLYLYDCDGALVNQVELQFPAGKLVVLPLVEFAEGLKLESGLRYGQLVVSAPSENLINCKIHGGDWAGSCSDNQSLSVDKSIFFPITLSEERSYVLAFCNASKSIAQLKGRLFFGKRTPEFNCVLPPLGSRIVSVNSQFSEFTAVPPGKELQAYLRLTSRERSLIGVQLIERHEVTTERFVYSCVS